MDAKTALILSFDSAKLSEKPAYRSDNEYENFGCQEVKLRDLKDDEVLALTRREKMEIG